MLRPNYDELVALKNHAHPISLRQRSKVQSPAAGQHSSLFKGRGLDFSEFREYAPGDDTRAIDWKVTARTGRAHTKLFTEERERSVFVIVDTNHYMQFGTRGTFKSIQAARAASIIAWRGNRLHDKTGAILFGDLKSRVRLLPAKRSRQSIWQLLKLLSGAGEGLIETQISEALQTANLTIPTGSSVFIISDFFKIDGEFELELGILSRRCDVSLVKITDPSDLSLPMIGEARFWNSAGTEAWIDTDQKSGLASYRKISQQREQSLQAICEKLQVRRFDISTDHDVATDLLCSPSAQSTRNRVERNRRTV